MVIQSTALAASGRTTTGLLAVYDATPVPCTGEKRGFLEGSLAGGLWSKLPALMSKKSACHPGHSMRNIDFFEGSDRFRIQADIQRRQSVLKMLRL